MGKLDFVSSGYAKDFFALADVPKSWHMTEAYQEPHELRFVAYDTSARENERGKALDSLGVGYDCVVSVVAPECGTGDDIEVHHFTARDRVAAEKTFSTLYEELLESKPSGVRGA